MHKPGYARIQLTSLDIRVRFEKVGPQAIFDVLLDSFYKAVPDAKFDKNTRWQSVPLNQLGELAAFCFNHFEPENVRWQVQLSTEDEPRQLVLPSIH